MKNEIRFALLVLAIVVLASVRSLIATRLDGFTIDEPYHIVSGVSYLRTGDFRLNPEQPPLVKLWAGAFITRGFHLPPFRAMQGKLVERDFHESAMFLNNNAEAAQQRARGAMVLFHAALLVAFAFAARRVVGPYVALGALTFLAIDPTVAAHMPVVMTDLPIALMSSIALLTAVAAFRSWRVADLVIATAAMGLMLGTKHNGIVGAIVIAAIGLFAALRRNDEVPRARRLSSVAAMLFGSIVILWGLYGFRYAETSTGIESFNEPLTRKIAALHTPMFRSVLTEFSSRHLLPRAYLWGLADVLRAGVEGRAYPFVLFGHTFIGHTPFYYFPAVVGVKLPIGLLLLVLLGFVVAYRAQPRFAFAAVGALLVGFLFALMKSNSGYAGVRHALPLFPPLAIFGGLALAEAWERRVRIAFVTTSIALIAAIASAIPVIRPWEYYNEIAGGHENSWRNFSDEGADLGQRMPELAAFYDKVIRPSGEPAFDDYGVLQRDRERRHMNLRTYDDAIGDSDVIRGWVVMLAPVIPMEIPWADHTPFLSSPPVARFGNLLVFHGTYKLPWLRAQHIYFHAVLEEQRPKADLAAIERDYTEATSILPHCVPMLVSLGNTRAKLGRRNEAIHAFTQARAVASSSDPIIAELDRQIARIAHEPPQKVPTLTNPWAE